MPLQATSGAASQDGFGGNGVPVVPNYIEEVFSTYLYTGNSSTQTITNGIDLSTKGGLVWLKQRSLAGGGSGAFNVLTDTARGVANTLVSSSTVAQNLSTNQAVNSVSTTGFVLANNADTNLSSQPYVSWTFRKQPKFFDIVTYTGTGSNRTIAHALGSVPGCIIIKRTDTTAAWAVYHRSLANTQYLVLNTTAAAATGATRWNSTTPTSTVFSVGTDATVNASGGTYVAYIFAHDAGGFGLTGTDNVISCGSYVGDGTTTQLINLGFEPQWLMVKISSLTDNWFLSDIMRGLTNFGSLATTLEANTADAEEDRSIGNPTANGFLTGSSVRDSGETYIYVAIRRGPMKVPTTGTSVFGLSARTGTGANATVTGGQTDDAVLIKNRGSAVASLFASRLTGVRYLVTSSTAADVAAGVTELQVNPWDVMDGVKVGTTSTITNASGSTFANYLFKRAPNFFDVSCYTGTGAATTVAHNLQAVPELIIVKKRSGGTVRAWYLYVASLTSSNFIQLNSTLAATNLGTFPWNSTTPTSSVFSVSSDDEVNGSANTYIAYLFATLAGVSKVGTFTGNGTTQTIDCGLTAGARFVLLKRTDATGDWYVYDTARGMTTLTDPYWLTNTTAAEVATLGSVTTVATGFALNSTILAAINVSAGTYIFLAIA
jgi:hypothetical protein